MKNLLDEIRKYVPTRSLLGFKILNSWHSIINAYFLIIVDFFIPPLFGVETNQLIAGIYFIVTINSSIVILIINSVIRINKFNLFILLLEVPLLIYIPKAIDKIFRELNYLMLFNI